MTNEQKQLRNIKKINKQLAKYGFTLIQDTSYNSDASTFVIAYKESLKRKNPIILSRNGIKADELTLCTPENKLTSENDFTKKLNKELPISYKPEEIKGICSQLCHDDQISQITNNINYLISSNNDGKYLGKLIKQQLKSGELQHSDPFAVNGYGKGLSVERFFDKIFTKNWQDSQVYRANFYNDYLKKIHELQKTLNNGEKEKIIESIDKNSSVSNRELKIFNNQNVSTKFVADIINLARKEASLEEFRSFAQLRKNIDENRLAMQNTHDGQIYSPIQHLEERIDAMRKGEEIANHEHVETTDIYGRTSKTQMSKKQKQAINKKSR